MYSVIFLPFGYRSFCYIAAPARHLTLNFSFYLFSVPPIRKSSCSHWLGPTYKSPPLGLAERQSTTALSSSLSLLSCASDTRPPARPTSSSINNARNLSRLPANPYVHPFLLPSDTSKSYRDSRLNLPAAETTIDSSPFLKPVPPRVLELSGRNFGLFSLPFLYSNSRED